MPRYIVYQQLDGISLGEDEVEKRYAFIPEEDMKTGLVVPHSDPNLVHEPVGEVTADSVEQALMIFRERQANAFH